MAVPSIAAIHSVLEEGGVNGNIVPVWKAFALPEGDSTASVFLKVRRGPHSFILEGITDTEYKDRFAVIGTEPYRIVTTDGGNSDPLEAIEGEVLSWKPVRNTDWGLPADIPLAECGAVGYVTYDCVRYFESRVAPLVEKQKNVLGLPESEWMLMSSLVVVDLYEKQVIVVALCRTDSAADLDANYARALARIDELSKRITESSAVNLKAMKSGYTERSAAVSNVGAEGYKSMVNTLKEHIVKGDIIQAVPSQRLTRPTDAHPFDIYLELRAVNPSPYMFYLDMGDVQVVGASPERLMRITGDGTVTSHPIAGTRKRGRTPEEDKLLEVELLSDPKERAEHIMLVDLGRNDVNRICQPTTVTVDRLMVVERYSHVMHIVSGVSGTLRPEKTPFDAFRSIFPAGTVSGAPKVRAMQLISSLEEERRGIYAGSVGFASFGHVIDTCIALRTLIYKKGKAYIQAGGGIVFDSDDQLEFEETEHKMRALMVAVDKAEARLDAEKEPSSDVYPLASTRTPVAAGSFVDSLRASDAPATEKHDWTRTRSATDVSDKQPVLLIDNYDSFTWNLYQYLSQLGENVVVIRNDKLTVEDVEKMAPSHIVISPGPGHPVTDSGVSIEVMKHFMGKLPILGVCLGHQAMVELFGGKVVGCGEIKHGKTSTIQHDGKGLYHGVPGSTQGSGKGFSIIRYHSLGADEKLPDCLEVTSRSEKGHIMGVRHKTHLMEGVQYHPESIKSEFGKQMLANFLSWKGGSWEDNAGVLTVAEPRQSSVTRELIKKLYKAGGDSCVIAEGELEAAMKEMISGKATPAQVGALLTLVPCTGDKLSAAMLEESSKAMLGFARTIPELSIPADKPVVDIVGTGGDGKDAFNVSTASGFVVAACGCTVAKHGNRSSSGSVGSADFLEALGVNIDLDGSQVKQVLEDCGFCFLYAQKFHPAMKNVASIRREVGFRTIFNLLGPLTNPIRPHYQISGVSDFSIGETYAKLLAKQCKRSVVVLSKDGMDELSPSAGTHMWEADDAGKVTYTELAPTDFGLADNKYGPVESLEGVTGGTASERANMFIRLLSGDLAGSAFEDFIVVNSALSLVVAGKAESYGAAAEMAREAIRSGKAKAVLERYISLTNALKNGCSAPAAAKGPVNEMAGQEKKESILKTITAKKKEDLAAAKAAAPLAQLKEQIAGRPAALNLQHRLRQAGHMAVMAEIKRASPSRGDIDADLDAGRQAAVYAHAGAAAISVLTEEHWFKGSLADMRQVSDVVASRGAQRPAVLRKDFVFDEYQLYEARANGADTVLLIVAIMDSQEQLQSLLDKSRELGMEPLVEVNNDEEMKTALAVGAKVVGINNRNLHSFSVDLTTTERLVAGARSQHEEAADVSFVALSGIKGRADVERYESAGVKAVLVGEALVRATNPTQLLRQLLGSYTPALVKVCGIQDVATAASAIQSGADLLGLVFAKSSRKVTVQRAKEIVAAVRKLRGCDEVDFGLSLSAAEKGSRRLAANACALERAVRRAKPLVVGVFADQAPGEVWHIANEVGLDIIQLSGGVRESLGGYGADNVRFPVLKAVHVGAGDSTESVAALATSEEFLAQFHGLLLDTKDAGGARGGTGATFDWSVAADLAASGLPLFLAGGLNVDNVAKAVRTVEPFGVDVSSGVEASPAVKDSHKIQAFVLQTKLTPAPVTLTSFTRRQLDEMELHKAGAVARGKGRLSVVADEDLLHGWFGDFGGKYAPESLMQALGELEAGYYSAAADPLFQATLKELSSRYIGRPTPLYEARRLTAHCKGARIWLKREDLNHTGAHKINNAIAQALLALRLGKRRIIAETGAGQHGVATATACAMLKLECIVYMGSEDCRRQALNVFRMKNLGATVVPVNSGSCTLKDAINEAMRDWITNIETTHYLVGSAIGPHPFPTIVRDFQSVIGMECKRQMVLQAGKLPDAVVACVGGGSNAIGLFHPFVDEPTQIYGVEAGGHGVAEGKHSATIVAGRVGVLHGTRTLLLQDEEGQIIETHSISAGLDYPGVGPEHAWIAVSGRGKYVACDDGSAMKGFALLSELEGIVPALESSHAIHFGVELAAGMPTDQDVVISVSGRGDKDMNTVAETLGVDIK